MRKLASIKRIDSIDPIPNADAIDVATVGGWKVVIRKGEYQPGDLVVYCEVDSWIPHELAPFLSKNREPREYGGVKGEVLRTAKLRGQISQGLILPLYPTCDNIWSMLLEGLDVTFPLNIQKWEAPIPTELDGQARGGFPGFMPKTDQERVQNMVTEVRQWCDEGLLWEVTEKLDGTSMTVYVNELDSGVCGRNYNFIETESNSLWQVARREHLIDKLLLPGPNLALQGELIGPGIQGNPYKLTQKEFYLYDVYDIDKQAYLPPDKRREYAKFLGIKHVPLLTGCGEKDLGTGDVADLLQWAEGKSALNEKAEREGIVFKCTSKELSFKAVSNKFLLKS